MATDIFPGAKLMQVVEWGFPRGSLRPTPPRDKAFSVVHITANLATAENEAAWRIRDANLQNSATFFNNRDGSSVQLLGDPLHMDPWANGDVRTPDISNPRIAAMVRDGVNANERTLVAIENVGNEIAWGSVPGGHPITPAQESTTARIIRYYHGKAGVPINRQTVIGHYQLNSVTRTNCPSKNKAVLDRIVALANQTLPDTAVPEDDPMSFAKARPVPPYIAVIGEGTNTRPLPRLDSHRFTVPPGETRELLVVGQIEGDEFPIGSGNRTWLLYQTSGMTDFWVFHSTQQLSAKPLQSGVSLDSYQALQRLSAGFLDQLGQSATSAATKVREAKPS